MKAKITISCLLVLFLSFSVWAAAAEGEPRQGREIPGGVVFSNNRSIIYYDFKTGRETNLVSDLKTKGFKMAAVSPDAKVLVWLEKNRLWARVLLDGKPFLLPSKKDARNYPRGKTPRVGDIRDPLEDLPDSIKDPIENLSISTDKHYVVYQTRGMIPSNISEIDRPKLRKIVRKYPGRSSYPVPHKPMPLIERTRSIVREIIKGGPGWPCRFFGKPGYRKEIGRADACFPTWSKNGETLAFISHTTDSDKYSNGRWGPIVTTDLRPWKVMGRYAWESEEDYRKRKEIDKRNFEVKDIHPASCEGLAWRPDNTITYLSKGTVYSEDGKVIAQEIKGANLCWITNNAFIFRGLKGSLYLWQEGKQEKLLDSVPKEFSYCFRSPFAPSELDKALAKADKESEGKKRTKLSSTFYIGTIKIGTRGYSKSAIRVKTVTYDYDVYHNYKTAKKRGQLEFAFPDENFIREIKDPSQYSYKKTDPKTPEGRYGLVRVPLNQILLLKDGNKYAAIKAIEIEQLRHKGKPVYLESPVELTTNGPGGKKTEIIKRTGIPVWELLTYEWKYWPEIQIAASITDTKKLKKEETILPKETTHPEEAIHPEETIRPEKKIHLKVRNALSIGKLLEANKKFNLAQKKYQEIIRLYPDAPEIEKVKKHLQGLEELLKG